MSFLKQSLDNIKVWINDIIENSRLSHSDLHYLLLALTPLLLVLQRK